VNKDVAIDSPPLLNPLNQKLEVASEVLVFKKSVLHAV
jgi:hypothetical protein